MLDSASPPSMVDAPSIELRDPIFAAFLAWLIPGAGHFYQGRWGKGGLFMVCILGTFFVGLWMGQGRVVYASWRANDQRYAYICQVCVGLPALPAVVQSMLVNSNPPKAPFFDGVMAPPLLYGQQVPRGWAERQVARHNFDPEDFPDLQRQEPRNYVTYLRSDVAQEESPKLRATPSSRDPYNQLSDWNLRMGPFFELGTVYTLIAGLLNVLAIFDALAGPASPSTPLKNPADPQPGPPPLPSPTPA